MSWSDAMEPVRMRRIAVVLPKDRLRDALVAIAALSTVELDSAPDAELVGEDVRGLVRTLHLDDAQPLLALHVPDLADLAAAGRSDLVAGELQLRARATAAVPRDRVCGVLGWTPAAEVSALREAVEPMGAAVVELPNPPAVDPPTLVHSRGGLSKSFAPLVDTYVTVPYADVDPTAIAGLAFVVMFGMMFADAGQGALLLLGGLLLRAGWPPRAARLRFTWPFIVGSGAAAIVFGVLFGEFFGPTGVIPALWIEPLDNPVLLLQVAVAVGACLLALSYALGTLNRWREGGWRMALVSSSGIAGIAVFAGLGLGALGAYLSLGWLVAAAVVIAVGGLVLIYVGLLAASGGGAAGATEAGVELFDGVIRLGTNLISFARLGAFGLAHAALLSIVWQGTTNLWSAGGAAILAAVVLFLVGNALTFILEAVVAGVQALRLEYYEMFSRVFVSQGRPFRAWSIPVEKEPVP
jgi:V/A-type H+-transporting ATPase subunit I